jgi:hypothetical protein
MKKVIEDVSYIINLVLWLAITIMAMSFKNNMFLWGSSIILTIFLAERDILIKTQEIQDKYINFLVTLLNDLAETNTEEITNKENL